MKEILFRGKPTERFKDIPVGLEIKYEDVPIGEVKRVDAEKNIVTILIYDRYINMVTKMFEFEGKSSMEVLYNDPAN